MPHLRHLPAFALAVFALVISAPLDAQQSAKPKKLPPQTKSKFGQPVQPAKPVVPMTPPAPVSYTATMTISGKRPMPPMGSALGFKQGSSITITGALLANGVPDNTAAMTAEWVFTTKKSNPVVGYTSKIQDIGYVTPPAVSVISVTVTFKKAGVVVATASSQFDRVP